MAGKALPINSAIFLEKKQRSSVKDRRGGENGNYKREQRTQGYPGKKEEETQWQEIVLKTKSLVKIMNIFSKIWCFSVDTFKCMGLLLGDYVGEKRGTESRAPRMCAGADDNCSSWNLSPC